MTAPADPGTPAAPPAPATPPAPAAPPPDPTPPAAPGSISMTSQQLDDRLNRGFDSRLQQEFGTRDPAAVKAQLDELKTLKAAEEERKKAELTALELAKTETATAQAAQLAAEEQRDAAQFEQMVAAQCAALGVRNVEFAMWSVATAADARPESEGALDVHAFLTEELKDAAKQAALGFQAPPTQQATPATTTPAPGVVPPAEPPPGGPPNPAVDAFQMTPEQWQAKKAALGIQ